MIIDDKLQAYVYVKTNFFFYNRNKPFESHILIVLILRLIFGLDLFIFGSTELLLTTDIIHLYSLVPVQMDTLQ